MTSRTPKNPLDELPFWALNSVSLMRGKTDPQANLFTAAIDLEQRIRADPPLRAIKRMVDQDLQKMSRRFDAACHACRRGGMDTSGQELMGNR
jgi:hypothetical protein